MQYSLVGRKMKQRSRKWFNSRNYVINLIEKYNREIVDDLSIINLDSFILFLKVCIVKYFRKKSTLLNDINHFLLMQQLSVC